MELLDKYGVSHDYKIIKDLPSKFRLHKDIKSIYIRDLYFDEIKTLSMYLNRDYDIEQLCKIYDDIIKVELDDETFLDIRNLEMADFHYLVIISSILTEPDSNWKITKPCDNCGNIIKENVYYSDINYEYDEDLQLPMKLAGTDKYLNPTLVKDFISLLDDNIEKFIIQNNLKSIDESIVKNLLSYATALGYKDNKELYENFLWLNANHKHLRMMKEILKETMIKIAPFKTTCKSCGTINHSVYDFSVVRGYL